MVWVESMARAAETDQQPQLLEVVEVLTGLKQVCLKVKVVFEGVEGICLFRPEKTLKLTPDLRVPLPQELYRDIAYYKVCQLLGWDVAAPIMPWELNPQTKGVLRPYWPDISSVMPYSLREYVNNSDRLFWQRVACLDYLCGVIDRNANDILLIQPDNQPIVVDSGLSFVEDLNFVYDKSDVRDYLRHADLDSSICTDIASLTFAQVSQATAGFIDHAAIDHLLQRRDQQLLYRQVL